MNQVVVITGAASGFGRALALQWAKHGAHVCVADINDVGGQETCNLVEQAGGKAMFCHCDVTRDSDANQLRDKVLEKWNRVDVVINNAGVATADRIEDESLEQWQWVIEINLLSVVRMCKVFTPVFKKQGGGHFLNVASQAGITPIPYMSSYNVTKSAVVALSETHRLELADFNIGVSVMCPGFFNTNLGDSLKTTLPVMKKLLEKMLAKSDITAEEVAKIAYDGVAENKYMILSHKEGRQVFAFKRLFPNNWYFNSVLKRTVRLRQQVNESQ